MTYTTYERSGRSCKNDLEQTFKVWYSFRAMGQTKDSGRKDTLFYITDDKQKGHMGNPVKNILITLLINTSSNAK